MWTNLVVAVGARLSVEDVLAQGIVADHVHDPGEQLEPGHFAVETTCLFAQDYVIKSLRN